MAGIGESIGGVLGSLYDFISDPLSAYAGAPDAEIVAGPLSAGRRIEELHAEGSVEEGMGGYGGGNGPRVIVGHSPRYHQQDKVCEVVWGVMTSTRVCALGWLDGGLALIPRT